MKLSIEQANKLLSQLTAGVTVVADEQQADSNTDLEAVFNNISEVVGKSIRPTLEEEVKAAVEPAFTARYLGALRSAAHRVFNIPRKEMEDKSLEQLLVKCKGVLEGRYSQDDAERQTMWATTVQDYEQQLEQLKTEHAQQIKAEQDKYIQRDIAARCLSIIEKLPRKGGDLQEQADMLRYKMQKVYEVRYNEDTKRLEFYNDGKPAMSEDNALVSDEDFARTWAERAGILVRDTRHISPAEVQAGQQGTYAGIVLNNEEHNGNNMNAIEAWAEG